ncbi:MAG: hypothetical protein Q4B52_05280 [Tissierellia bacterium]|nr:hypothetical protein [Tissierellia bacterium]
MKRPIDRFKDKTKEEIEEKEHLLDEDNLEKYDKLAMFIAAIKVFLPPLLIIIALFLMLIFLF